MTASLASIFGRLRSLRAEQVATLVVTLVYLTLVLMPWWSTAIVPSMDYPEFLTFVRAAQDYQDPSSPYYGTYTLAFPLKPLVLPMGVARFFSLFGSIEVAGKLLWTLYAIGIPVAGLWLAAEGGGSRWNIVLLAPLVFSRWVSYGFFPFCTGVPLLLASFALALRFFRKPTRGTGIALAVLGASLVFWHALIAAMGLLGIAVLWCLWRAPSWALRWRALLPAAPMALGWLGYFLMTFLEPEEAAERIFFGDFSLRFANDMSFARIFMQFPGADVFAKLLGLALVASLLLQRFKPQLSNFRGGRPILALSATALICFFVLPHDAFGVEVLATRFLWLSTVLLAAGWTWPQGGMRRFVVLLAVIGIGGMYLREVTLRFRQFHKETAGASRLMDTLPRRANLWGPWHDTETLAFQNKPLRSAHQLAAVRTGGLPAGSFARYKLNYVRYVNENPMPLLNVYGWENHPELTAFDYVLLRRAISRDPRLREVGRDGDWVLYVICGSRLKPTC